MKLLAAIGFLLLLTPEAGAVMPDEILDDPALEARAREISKDLRCLVCQNQSIDDSDAPLARDLRLLVRERLVAGDSNVEAREFVVARYGDFVLLNPPVKPSTSLLWGGPALLVLLALLTAMLYYRRRAKEPAVAEAPLTDEERRRLEALLGEDGKR